MGDCEWRFKTSISAGNLLLRSPHTSSCSSWAESIAVNGFELRRDVRRQKCSSTNVCRVQSWGSGEAVGRCRVESLARQIDKRATVELVLKKHWRWSPQADVADVYAAEGNDGLTMKFDNGGQCSEVRMSWGCRADDPGGRAGLICHPKQD